MDTERLEKRLQIWNRFMYLILGSSITLAITSLYNLYNGQPDSKDFYGDLWLFIQLFATPPGFYLLWSKRWRSLSLPNRLNTIFGYFIASWFSFLSLGLIAASNAPTELNFFIVGSALLIVLGYIWALKRTSTPRDEMFP